MNSIQVEQLLTQLKNGPVLLADQSLSVPDLGSLGLEVANNQVCLPQDTELLNPELLAANFSAQAQAWCTELQVFPVIDSTNTWMMQQLPQTSIAGCVALAECQLAGRGRRGRAWQSPLGSNLAISLGFVLPGSLADLGGLSLAVGLAAVEALDPHGHLGITLKWPNDLLVQHRKLSGILVEAAVYAGQPAICVGIGVNWRLSQAVLDNIEQPAIDMLALDESLSRNRVGARLISAIVEFVELFGQAGFAPMQAAFDELHVYTDKPCVVHTGQGDVHGVVLGVTESGELRLQTSRGEQHFVSGEVSLRAQ